MLNAFKKIFSDRKFTPNEDLSTLNHNKLPVFTAEQLINKLSLHNRIRSIRRKVAIDSNRFESMYLQPIEKFCELAQLIPASQAYHHAFLGGLIVHTLCVVEYAINERMKYTLPLASEPEIIEAQKNLWTFAVFVAALLHDIGKAVTMVDYVDTDSGKVISPLAGTLVEQSIKNYKITFKPTRYFKLHEKLGIAFINYLFDLIAIGYLSSELTIFSEVLGYINNDADNWGSIGDIIKIADSLSTAEDLKIAPMEHGRKFTGANLENFGERLMRTIRLLINEKALPINRPGAVLFTSDNKFVYAVSKSLVERVREKMQMLGAKDIPTDNNRIFDELQQQGFCESTSNQEAIFNINVKIAEAKFDQNFTCLKFQINKIFTINTLPTPLKEQIVEIDKKQLTQETVTDNVVYKPETVKNTENQSDKISSSFESENSPLETETEKETPNGISETENNVGSETETVKEATTQKNENNDTQDDPEKIIKLFFDWL
ncbi:MobH family relaxase [Suttonella ornithocola]|uniref:Predicted HD-superfamily hydrolase n=1 Tax=Suttonella ornithocola TaxID=279832 RepID=A0A380MXJ7_9GAMM|nr:MobH family relaxase [Suttonella ornithocola]SUO96623.1 Predicted HD-superfamily hydrolase [Suttonella ornithocola]